MMILDFILVKRSGLKPRHKQFKDAGIAQALHLVASAIPHIKVTDYADAHGARCPHGKINAFYTVNRHGMRAHLAVYIVINACVKLFQLRVRKLGRKCVRILHFLCRPVIVSNLQKILGHLLSMQKHRVISGLILQFHGIALISNLRCHGYRVRHKYLDQQSLFYLMCSQQTLWICCLGIHDLFNSSPVH